MGESGTQHTYVRVHACLCEYAYIFFFNTLHDLLCYVFVVAVAVAAVSAHENPKWTVAVVVLNNIQSEDVYSIVRARNTHRASTTQHKFIYSINFILLLFSILFFAFICLFVEHWWTFSVYFVAAAITILIVHFYQKVFYEKEKNQKINTMWNENKKFKAEKKLRFEVLSVER